jgi:hypothetical protein
MAPASPLLGSPPAFEESCSHLCSSPYQRLLLPQSLPPGKSSNSLRRLLIIIKQRMETFFIFNVSWWCSSFCQKNLIVVVLTFLQAGLCRLLFLGNLFDVRFVLLLLSTTASKLVLMLFMYPGEVGE